MWIVGYATKFEFVQDFMVILITCKFDEQPFINDIAIVQTTFS